MRNLSILTLLAVILIAFAYFTIFSDPAYRLEKQVQKEAATLSQKSTATATKTDSLPKPFSGSGSLQSLAQKNQDLECTITFTDEQASTTVEGTFFTNHGDIRTDMLTQAPDLNGQILSSMIVKNNTMYIWSEIEGRKYGVKMDLAQADEAVKNQSPVSLEQTLNYDCKPWPKIDRTVFDPPSDVLFNDANELIKAGMEDGTIYKEQPVPELP